MPVACFLSLVSLDEHLTRWLDSCNLGEKTTEPTDADTLLRRVMAIWPSLLRLLTERTVEQSKSGARVQRGLSLVLVGGALESADADDEELESATAALPLLIAACDVLMSVSRNVPIETVGWGSVGKAGGVGWSGPWGNRLPAD